MNLNKLKPAWEQYKWINGQTPLTDEEVLSALQSAGTNRTRSLLVNVMMLLTLLLVCY